MNVSNIYILLIFLKLPPSYGQRRIVGGHSVLPHSIRYQVSLKRPGGIHYCGGSLIHRRWVLTAAHCKVGGAESVQIIAGEHSITRYEGTEQMFCPSKMIPHPRYDPESKDSDIMLIKVGKDVEWHGTLEVGQVTASWWYLQLIGLSNSTEVVKRPRPKQWMLSRPARLNYFVGIVPLPRRRSSLEADTLCRVSGWGFISPNGKFMPRKLRAVRLPIVSNSQCNRTDSYNGNITANMICAGFKTGGKDSCQGDSGGPLVCKGRIYGIVSWGKLCGDGIYPGVYTAVARFRNWIIRTINQS